MDTNRAQVDPFESNFARLMADPNEKSGYEKLLYGLTPDDPIIIPSSESTRMIGCVCEEESAQIIWWKLHEGETLRCDCGHHFKLEKQTKDTLAAEYNYPTDVPEIPLDMPR